MSCDDRSLGPAICPTPPHMIPYRFGRSFGVISRFYCCFVMLLSACLEMRLGSIANLLVVATYEEEASPMVVMLFELLSGLAVTSLPMYGIAVQTLEFSSRWRRVRCAPSRRAVCCELPGAIRRQLPGARAWSALVGGAAELPPIFSPREVVVPYQAGIGDQIVSTVSVQGNADDPSQ